MIKPELFPIVEEEYRPRPLYVDFHIPKDEKEQWADRGWVVTDVRGIGDRSEAVKATLEGVRLGTIAMDKEQLNCLTLEAKIQKLLLNKEAAKEDEGEALEKSDISAILSIGKPKDLPAPKNRKVATTGRPRTKGLK